MFCAKKVVSVVEIETVAENSSFSKSFIFLYLFYLISGILKLCEKEFCSHALELAPTRPQGVFSTLSDVRVYTKIRILQIM